MRLTIMRQALAGITLIEEKPCEYYQRCKYQYLHVKTHLSSLSLRNSRRPHPNQTRNARAAVVASLYPQSLATASALARGSDLSNSTHRRFRASSRRAMKLKPSSLNRRLNVLLDAKIALAVLSRLTVDRSQRAR